jgi:quinate dehydrogenase (quinone)
VVRYVSRNLPMVGLTQAPCLQPPHGTLTAVDLSTRKVAWEVPTGGAEAQGPFGLASGVPLPIGTVGLGGPVATASGLVFHAATTDPYLRAYDSSTGKLLWAAKLPVGVGGTPMTYVSPKTGKQYVAVSAGGARLVPGKGDYVMAFALP